MAWSEYAGSIRYVVPIWILSGVLMLVMDKALYAAAKMKKEKKIAVFLGWVNITFGVGIYVANWILVRMQ